MKRDEGLLKVLEEVYEAGKKKEYCNLKVYLNEIKKYDLTVNDIVDVLNLISFHNLYVVATTLIHRRAYKEHEE